MEAGAVHDKKISGIKTSSKLISVSCRHSCIFKIEKVCWFIQGLPIMQKFYFFNFGRVVLGGPHLRSLAWD